MHKFLCQCAKEFLLTKSRARLPFLSPPAPDLSLESIEFKRSFKSNVRCMYVHTYVVSTW